MNSRVGLIAIGLFVVLLSAALVGMGLWLSSGVQPAALTRYSVYTTESVAGLRRDAPVTFNGVDVGQVERIALDTERPGRVHLVLAVRADTPVRRGTRATVSQQGLTGIAFVDLGGGTGPQPPETPPGEPYPVLETEPSELQRLQDGARRTLASLNGLTEDLRSLLSEDNRRAAAETLASLQRFSGELDARVERLLRTLDGVDRFLAQGSDTLTGTRDTLASLDTLITSGQAVVDRAPETLAGLERTLAQAGAAALALEDAARQAEALGREGQHGLSRAARRTLPELEQTLTRLRLTLSSMDRLLDSLSADPARLLRGAPPRPPGPGEARP